MNKPKKLFITRKYGAISVRMTICMGRVVYYLYLTSQVRNLLMRGCAAKLSLPRNCPHGRTRVKEIPINKMLLPIK